MNAGASRRAGAVPRGRGGEGSTAANRPRIGGGRCASAAKRGPVMKQTYDYIVVGGGIGSAAGYRLSREAGAEVLVLEQFQLGYDQAASDDDQPMDTNTRALRRV
jgi:hypothetical protein